jgi:single-strand DNA-binding protein
MINNIAILEGNLGKDPEIKQLEGGKFLCNFSLAVYRNKEKTDWIDCVAFNNVAEVLRQADKGRKITVWGSFQQRTWEKDGKKNSKVEVLADRLYVHKKREPMPSDGAESTPF